MGKGTFAIWLADTFPQTNGSSSVPPDLLPLLGVPPDGRLRRAESPRDVAHRPSGLAEFRNPLTAGLERP